MLHVIYYVKETVHDWLFLCVYVGDGLKRRPRRIIPIKFRTGKELGRKERTLNATKYRSGETYS
jgi:hypothetical protein